MRIHFVGDIHGKINEFLVLVNSIPQEDKIIQLGDVGFGFVEIPELPKNVSFIRGNHDSPILARYHKNYLGDFGAFEIGSTKIMYISGANSIDKNSRVHGVSWWSDEELTYLQLENAIRLGHEYKPDIVISHDCPHSISQLLQSHHMNKTKTNLSLDALYDNINPKLWLFGHHHISWEQRIHDTLFVCLDELQVKTIEVEVN